jgi:cation diffusion facilitator CzcD-associated flavoprotein CzcO
MAEPVNPTFGVRSRARGPPYGAQLRQPILRRVNAPSTPLDVLILGGGMSGLAMGTLLRRSGERRFVIVEKSAGPGGTWWDNRYPGAHVDVPAPLYSFSWAPNPDWTRRFAAAPEIQAYVEREFDRQGLRGHLQLGHAITAARFDADVGLWRFATDDGRTLAARHFVCSAGPLSQPRWPAIEGLETFAGTRLHSARWDDRIALDGRRIGVIGTGSTAAQLIPPLARRAARLSVFQRTAHWVLPRLDRRYGALDRALAHVPPYAAAVRTFWYHVLEWGRRGFDDGTLARRSMTATAERLLRAQVPDAALRDRLRPRYPLGCKRIIYASDYYPVFTQPHVALVSEDIVRIVPEGVVTADGRLHALDVLVCATGFDAARPLQSLRVEGLDGRTLADDWHDGAEAFHGVTVTGYPNLYLMLGPNTGTGHTSTLLYIEAQARYALRAMAALRAGGHRWADLRPEVQQAHNAALQARLQGSVWTMCRSWYRHDNGRITALFPGYTREYVRALARWNPADYRLA